MFIYRREFKNDPKKNCWNRINLTFKCYSKGTRRSWAATEAPWTFPSVSSIWIWTNMFADMIFSTIRLVIIQPYPLGWWCHSEGRRNRHSFAPHLLMLPPWRHKRYAHTGKWVFPARGPKKQAKLHNSHSYFCGVKYQVKTSSIFSWIYNLTAFALQLRSSLWKLWTHSLIKLGRVRPWEQ